MIPMIKGDTCFFRYSDVLVPLSKDILRTLSERRIASVGCSTGEEVYSLIIWNWPHQLLVDGYERESIRLAVARDGEYEIRAPEESAFPAMPAYSVTPGARPPWMTVQITEQAIARASFQQLDIIAKPLPYKYDAIILSNVLQHLDWAEREETLENVRESLNHGGWMVCEPYSDRKTDSAYLLDRNWQYNRWRKDLKKQGFIRQSLPHATRDTRIYRRL